MKSKTPAVNLWMEERGGRSGEEGVSAAGASASDTAFDGLSHIFTPREQKHFWQNNNTFGKRSEQKFKTNDFYLK